MHLLRATFHSGSGAAGGGTLEMLQMHRRLFHMSQMIVHIL